MYTPSAHAVEGRANWARPSLCLLFIGLSVLASPVSQASAEPTKPKLGWTDPASPSTSLTPFVVGSSDGVITFSVPAMTFGTRPILSSNPSNTIKLFTDAGCTSLLAQGTAGEFDSTGIQVTVKPDTTTAIYANQTEGSETSGCSDPIFYTHMTHLPDPPPSEPPPGEGGSGGGSGGPPAGGSPSVGSNQPAAGVSQHPGAPHLKTVPGGSANQNSILIAGTAPGAGAVRIFTSSDCSGPPIAKGSASQFTAGFPLQVVDNTTSTFYAVSVGSGGAQSDCSDPVTYVEDSTAPHTRITLGPASKTRNRSPVFRFTDITGDVPGTAFYCKVDKRRWTACRTPLHLRKLKLSSHLLRVKAIDPAGNAEVTGAKRRFRVVPRP